MQRAAAALCCLTVLALLVGTSFSMRGQRCNTEYVVCVINRNQNCSSSQDMPRNYTRSISAMPEGAINCPAVKIFLARGTHNLNGNITFAKTVQNVTMMGKPSVVECENGTGIKFGEISNGRVSIRDVSFVNCGIYQTVTDQQVPVVALLFRDTPYHLVNVTVTDTGGYSVYGYRSPLQYIQGCRFIRNYGPVFIDNRRNTVSKVQIVATLFTDGLRKMGNASDLSIYTTKSTYVNISGCSFLSSKASHLSIWSTTTSTEDVNIHIENCEFSNGGSDTNFSTLIGATNNNNRMSCVMVNCNYTNNRHGALQISKLPNITIDNCHLTNTNGTGLFINQESLVYRGITSTAVTKISNSLFKSNYRALQLHLRAGRLQTVRISNCNFTAHQLPPTPRDSAKNIVEITGNSIERNRTYLTIADLNFASNKGTSGNCSALSITSMIHTTMDNVSITDNYCTGLTLASSNVAIRNTLHIANNQGMFGGGIRMQVYEGIHSKIHFTARAQLSIVNNSAYMFGGGIYTDQNCQSENRDCIFTFEDTPSHTQPAISFKKNKADLGGDAIFGGCVQNCSVQSDDPDRPGSENLINYISSTTRDNKSISVFADMPEKVVFCDPDTQLTNTSMEWSVFSGQTFIIHMMITDRFNTPSVETIQAIVSSQGSTKLKQGQINLGKKFCKGFTFSIVGQPRSQAEVQIFPQQQRTVLNAHPALLTVNLTDCLHGFEICPQKKCVCNEKLKNFNIGCETSNFTLEVRRWTWIGLIDEKVAINTYCRFCSNEETITLHDLAVESESDKLCIQNRTGKLCAACRTGYSLQLGANECGECANSIKLGILLLVCFAVMGVLLIAFLLCLNLTVSSGLVNSLIFYSNIVHASSEIFLPTSTGPLRNTVRYLSGFQAWINLDLGINTCFFPNYDTYTSTWAQFAFPIYIWLLILTLVVVSRYSSKVSRLTGTNTVPVLATLLLLSYAKLLMTIITAASYTQMKFLDNSHALTVWAVDGNIEYVKRKHIPLFLFSGFMALCYIIPFTALILLGPLLQAKSDHRLLSWIHRLKPFLDAFYGPYNDLYRYWPGLLLIARVILLGIFAFYSHGSASYKIAAILTTMSALYLAWNLLRRGKAVSPHRNRCLNYLELFFHFNLSLFAIFTMYFSYTGYMNNSTKKQQILAVVMVGTTYIIFCCIVLCQIFRFVLVRCKIANKFSSFCLDKVHSSYLNRVRNFWLNKVQRYCPKWRKVRPKCDEGGCSTDDRIWLSTRRPGESPREEGSSVSRTVVDVSGDESMKTNFELREPLLND